MTEVFLSQLLLNLRSREVQRDLSDGQQMHRSVMAGFPSEAASRAAAGVLYRVELDGAPASPLVLVQSGLEPRWLLPSGYLRQAAAVRSLAVDLADLAAGDRVLFRLVANATRRIMTGIGTKNGARVPLRNGDARLHWLLRRGAAAGFSLRPSDVRIDPVGPVTGRKADPSSDRQARLTFEGVRYQGVLEVVDPNRFREAVVLGVGPGKAYGFGLLSFRRLPLRTELK